MRRVQAPQAGAVMRWSAREEQRLKDWERERHIGSFHLN
jgi:hypothetical protein